MAAHVPPRVPRVLVAQIGAAHGLRGEVRLWSFMQDPMVIKGYSLHSEDGARTFAIESLRPGKDFLVARFAGVADRNAAEALRNLKLYVPRDQLPEPDTEEFYHADLVGLAAVDTSGRALGRVVAIHNFGAGDIIEIKPETGTGVMLPFTAAIVPTIDVAGGRLIVDPPAGTFDDDGAAEAADDDEPAPGGRKGHRMPAR